MIAMEDLDNFRHRLRGLFESQKLAVLSTQSDGQPYASLVAFWAPDDLKSIYFATPNTTRKFANLAAFVVCPYLIRIALWLLISNELLDFLVLLFVGEVACLTTMVTAIPHITFFNVCRERFFMLVSLTAVLLTKRALSCIIAVF